MTINFLRLTRFALPGVSILRLTRFALPAVLPIFLVVGVLGLALALPAGPAVAQETPHSGCDHMVAGNVNNFIKSNEADDCLDNATQATADIAVPDANLALTDAQQQGSATLRFTGALTADRTITLTADSKRLGVMNATTGGFNLIFTHGAGATVKVSQGIGAVLQGDGTDVRRLTDMDVGSLAVGATIDPAADRFPYLDVSTGAVVYTLGEDLPGSGGGGGGGTITVLSNDWEIVASASPSGGASVDFTGLDASLYSEFRLAWYNVKLSADDSIALRFETGGGGFDSGSNYEWSFEGSGPVPFQADDASATEIQFGGGGGSGGANETQSGWLKIPGPGDAVWQTVNGSIALEDVNNNANQVKVGGHWENAGALSGVQLITTGAATFDSGLVVLRGRRITPLAGAATVQTSDATVTTLASQAIAADSAVTIQATVQGREDATGDAYHAVIIQGCRNEAGTTTCLTQDRVELTDAGAATWDVSIVADDTADAWDLDVTGEAAHTIAWVVHFETVLQVGP